MRSIGGTLFFFGVGSIVLYFLGMQFILLMWMEHMSEPAAWGTRIAMIVIGGLMWLLGERQE